MKPKSVPVKIQIPKPCSQSWAEMKPENGGRHCAACAQTVTDFTRMTDAQILEVLRNSAGSCGRFTADQLGRELIVPPAEKRFSLAPFYKLAASWLLVFSAGKVTAQVENSKATIHSPESINHKENIGEKRFISGIVTEQTGDPLTGAQVRLTSAKFKFLNGAATGIDGEFKCEIPSNISPNESLQLTVQYSGYQTDTIKITQNTALKPLDIALLRDTSSQTIIVEEVEFHTMGLIKPLIGPEHTQSAKKPLVPLNDREIKMGKARIMQPKKWWQFWKHNPKHQN